MNNRPQISQISADFSAPRFSIRVNRGRGNLWINILLCFALTGCAQRYVPAPSAAAVHASITSTQTHIDQASQQNIEARSVAQRVHDKDLLIDRWNETHRQ